MATQVNLKNDIYIGSTLAWCETCKKSEFARISASNDGVFMQRVCSDKMPLPIKIAADYNWYIDRMKNPQTIEKIEPNCKSENTCPLDCGLCEWHTSSIKLPVFSITNRCNLDCPICFTYNRSDVHYYKSVEDTKKILHHVFSKKEKKQIVNITGGEPTMHPQIKEILNACNQTGIERVTMNTNGIKIAEDPELAQMLKNANVQPVLSLDTFDSEKSIIIHGKDISSHKRKTLQILEDLQIPTTILCVCIKGLNETDVADIVSTYLRKDFVKSITIQNMTFTGKNGSQFGPHEHITIDEIEQVLSEKSDFSKQDFFPLASYHPLCYSVAYYIVSNGKIIPMTKIIDKELLIKGTEGLYYLEPDNDITKSFITGVNKLWAEGADDDVIDELKQLMKSIHPTNADITNDERKAILEQKIKSIYIHAHMDADNFDVDRVSRCGDIVPDENGRMIPACSYNLLYRQQDTRFWIE